MMRRTLVALLLAAAAHAPAWAQANPSFNVSNRAGSQITELYASPAGVTNWGRNRLVGVAVPPGQRYAIRLPADGNCMYDVRVVYANGDPEERRGVNTCNVDDLPFPAAAGNRPTRPDGRGGTRANRQQETDDPSFRLVNSGRSEVNEVYASPVGDDGWGTDRLGDDTVAPGATRVIRLPTGQCTWDVRIVYANGKATEKRRLDLCSITDLRVP
jgi:hypothetical protein